jgi:hypothetical protein
MSLEMAQKVIVPQKKNYVPQFLKQRTLIVIVLGQLDQPRQDKISCNSTTTPMKQTNE